MIPYSKQTLNQDDVDAVLEVLSQKFITQGPQVTVFENEICKTVSANHAVACNSATSALHIACLALDIGPGDMVWTSPISFVASANAARYCGADIDFVDIDPDTNNIAADVLSQKLKNAAAQNKLPKCIIVVHLCGLPCDMEEISALAKEYGIYVIEDASHALGAQYQGKSVGNGDFSDLCVFSFHAVKIITTAEGGIVTTNSPDLHQKLIALRSHGIIRDGAENEFGVPSDIFYRQTQLGYNYRMSELHAALGVSQLQRLDTFYQERQKTFDHYCQHIRNDHIVLPHGYDDRQSSHHLFVIKAPMQGQDNIRNALFHYMKAEGIQTNLHYIPIFLHPDFKQYGIDPDDFPNAMRYFNTALSIPLFPFMTTEDRDHVVAVINGFEA